MPLLVEPHLPAGSLHRHVQPTLNIDDLVVRPWRPSDTDAVTNAFSDPVIQQWHSRTMTPAEADGWILRWRSEWAAETSASWAMELNHVAIGQVGLRLINLAGGAAEISYWVRPQMRGRGHAPRALTVLTEWSVKKLGLHRLELNHAIENEASCRVATKVGYAVEGTRRSQALHLDGWHDMHMHALVAAPPVTGDSLIAVGERAPA